LKLRIRPVLSDKIARRKRGFTALTPPPAARLACPPGAGAPFDAYF
jgi:hypothetical protein